MTKFLSSKLILFLLGLSFILACKTQYFRNNYTDANKLLHETEQLKNKPFLKAHMKNGDLWILYDAWTVDTVQNLLNGQGVQYNHNRTQIGSGQASIPIQEVLIFETNQQLKGKENGRIAALAILGALNVAGAISCQSNPKACFGSCPTFYQNENDDFHFADAEGFSNAIAPSLEYSDIDALNNAPLKSKHFSLTMKNEALETHCVREVQLLACPRKPGERIFQTPENQFLRCGPALPLLNARGPEGDVSRLLRTQDREERFSLSDPDNLSSKETIFLEFAPNTEAEALGLTLDFRQTLMTTYFIYSAIAYMGDQVSDIFARMESSSDIRGKLNKGLKKELGGVDISVWDENLKTWRPAGSYYETGPIAINRQMLHLGNIAGSGPVRLKIDMNKGLWRLDYAALHPVHEVLEPIALKPTQVKHKGQVSATALAELNDPAQLLLSMPGDAWQLDFNLPAGTTDYELFLYSKGYYIEWMREEWLRDKNLLKLRQLLENPKYYLKSEAPAYKAYEASMEDIFWNSRIDTKNFSYHEN